MDLWNTVAAYLKDIYYILLLVILLVKPVREWLFGIAQVKEGQRCLLRSEIVRIYYRHHDDRQLREYEFKNMEQCYQAYKALGGNSFVERIYEEMREWDIV
ncbi:MAG: hypothetical protein IJN67_11660 [Oscillospiraceae bacterium]|nr:hypothetical protein [Oscillospiraceae bacterium]